MSKVYVTMLFFNRLYVLDLPTEKAKTIKKHVFNYTLIHQCTSMKRSLLVRNKIHRERVGLMSWTRNGNII